MLNETIATHPLETPPKNQEATQLLYFMYCQTYLVTSSSNRTHKKSKKKEKIERNEAHAVKWNKWWTTNSNMYHETTPFIVFICNKKRVHAIHTSNICSWKFRLHFYDLKIIFLPSQLWKLYFHQIYVCFSVFLKY